MLPPPLYRFSAGSAPIAVAPTTALPRLCRRGGKAAPPPPATVAGKVIVSAPASASGEPNSTEGLARSFAVEDALPLPPAVASVVVGGETE